MMGALIEPSSTILSADSTSEKLVGVSWMGHSVQHYCCVLSDRRGMGSTNKLIGLGDCLARGIIIELVFVMRALDI